MKYLLDTDHISFYQNARAPEHAALTSRMAKHPSSDFAFSLVSYHEQFRGVHAFLANARTTVKLIRGYVLLEQLRTHYSIQQVLPFDTAAGACFDSLVAQRIRIGTMDLRIGSIALARKLTLLTRNVSDFSRVPGLNTEDWTT